ncbi:MAG: hypothetical protein OXF02_07665 [Simkaniaceae bacterium]|nr:hypothetical protein [Simkaniaceae bacterium]
MERRSLPDVHLVNVNHKASLQATVSARFCELFVKRRTRNILLSLITFGSYPYKQYKKVRYAVIQALAVRKLRYFRDLSERIEAIRKEQKPFDARQSLKGIFMQVQSEKISREEGAFEFKAVFTLPEILLFITNPIRDRNSISFHHLQSSRLKCDYLAIWRAIKKKSRANQYRQVQNINLCNKTLKTEYHLTSDGIHDRLTRTQVYRDRPYLLTRFKELGKAFQEVVFAYQTLDELESEYVELFKFLQDLAKTSKKDIEILQSYLVSRYLPEDLSLQQRRQLIQLGNRQDILAKIAQEEYLAICPLILNGYQWEFLLSLQEVSHMTLNLLDWAFEESPKAMKKPTPPFEETVKAAEERVKDCPELFPSLTEAMREDPIFGLMTCDFAQELMREWPSFRLLEGDDAVYRSGRCDALTQDALIECYKKLFFFTEGDTELFIFLQEAVSRKGQSEFKEAVEEGVLQLLGKKSEYFIPILSNTDITIIRMNKESFEVRYRFEQIVTKQGKVHDMHGREKYMIVHRPLKKEEGKWISCEPEVTIHAEKRGL